MQRKRRIIIATVGAIALAGGGVGIAQALGGEDEGAPITGPDADRAKAAAIRLVPGGSARAVERDGEKGAVWEVEVRKPDGSSVDVRLGTSFEKVSIDADVETPGDADTGSEK